MLSAETTKVLRLGGGLTLDLESGALNGEDGPAFLRPKPHALLAHLAKNVGRVVPKAELMDAVWPGVFVTEDSLTQAVKGLRKVIGDDLIRTVPKRGYMLAGETEPVRESSAQPIVAVLRFRNESGELADIPIVDGFADDIINGLARFGTVTVLARNSSFDFMSHGLSDRAQIRSRIGADYLVEGSVMRQEGSGLVAVNLVDASSGSLLWGDRYQTDGSNTFVAMQNITERIVSRLMVRVGNDGLKRTSRTPLANLAAYELALRGVALLRDPAQSDLKGAAGFFEAAIAKDPAYGLAHAYLGLSQTLHAEFGPVSREALLAARDLADKGAALAPDQATCRRVQSLVRIFLRQHEAAEHYLRLALELNAYDPECIEQMGFLFIMRGRPLDALAWLDRAVRINPLHPHWSQYDRSMAHYMLGDYRAAAEALDLSTRPMPWIRTRLAACLAQLGRIDEAMRHMSAARQEAPDFSPLDYVRTGIPFEHPADAEHLTEGVLMAMGERAPT